MVAILRGKRRCHRMTAIEKLEAPKVDLSSVWGRFETGQERGNYETLVGDF